MDTHQPAPHGEDTTQPTPGEHSPVAAGVFCPDCGYDLRSLTSERCPECGFGLELVRSPESQIPWSRRRELGRFRAYWKTVLLVMRRPKRFCVEMVRPVSYADSQSFRWLTVLHAWLPILIGSVFWYFYDQECVTGGSGMVTAVLVGLVSWSFAPLVALPGVASYFFHPRRLSTEQQNRAIALSYYAWAPLAWAPLLLVPGIELCSLAVDGPAGLLRRWWWLSGPSLAVGFTILPVLLLLILCRLHLFLQRIARHGPWAALWRIVILALLVLLLTVLILLIPLSIFWLAVVYHSLH